ncbi:MAG: hypothetical protein ACK58L_07455 [Planctomycetota bacterium]
MLCRAFILSCCLTMTLSAISQADEKTPAKGSAQTVEVKLKDLTLNLPKSWSQSDVVNQMRLATYDIPAVEGDMGKGELAVSTFGGDGGGVGPNIDRWVGQFEADGRDVTVKQGKVGETVYHVADISGTYLKPVGPPVLRKSEPTKGQRMLGVIIQLKGKGVYFLKLTGPDKTVKAQADALRASFGATSEGEEVYEL